MKNIYRSDIDLTSMWRINTVHVAYIDDFWLVVSNIFIFHFIYGMSSFPLTFIFFKMVKTTNQI